MMTPRQWLTVLCGLSICATAAAHDTWVETNTNLIRTGDAIYVDLKLGNHGNDHRDFKLASKLRLQGCTLHVTAPEGVSYDLCDELIDTGYAPKEGFWRAKFVAMQPGLHLVSHTLDTIVNHGRPIRAIKSGKTCFVTSDSLDRVPEENPGFDRVLGHPLELVPTANPVTPMGPGQPIAVQVLLKGKPFAKARVAFVPRGVELADDFDETYERQSDEQGFVTFTPRTGNQYLVVVHHHAEEEKSEDYDATSYSATLTVFVPELCPCCGE